MYLPPETFFKLSDSVFESKDEKVHLLPLLPLHLTLNLKLILTLTLTLTLILTLTIILTHIQL